MNETIYIVYKITNNVNKKYYLGYHKTNNVNDSYMGSGTIIRRAISKYGVDSFTKEILHICDNLEDVLVSEKSIIGDLWKLDECYNQCPGGYGGFQYINDTGLRVDGMLGKKHSDATKKLMSDKKKLLVGDKHPRWGIKHTTESNAKNSATQQGIRQAPVVNVYHTPWGNFDSCVAISSYLKTINIHISKVSLYGFCVNNSRTIPKKTRLNYFKEYIGMTYKDLGFYHIKQGDT